jgi:hypothetical protein
MVSDRPLVPIAEFESRTGWQLKPEGACRGPVCVPLGLPLGAAGIDLRVVAERLAMPLVHDEAAGLWALGPPAGPALEGAMAPDLSLPDWRGATFSLSSLRGSKVLVVAWAPW